jgi:hypothetical protein
MTRTFRPHRRPNPGLFHPVGAGWNKPLSTPPRASGLTKTHRNPPEISGKTLVIQMNGQ